MHQNYEFSFRKRNKFIFVPNEDSVRKGEKILRFFEQNVTFPDYFFHYRKGGHVAAIHAHIGAPRFFFRLDIQNFFYSISRNRVAAALHDAGFVKARTYAKWSCVKNPLSIGPQYALPIGFIQSPALASLVLAKSPVRYAIERAMTQGVKVSVYLDDLVGSAVDQESLTDAYNDLVSSFYAANLKPSATKIAPPSLAITAFNCEIRQGFAAVTAVRAAEFHSTARSTEATLAFDAYCRSVEVANL